MAHKNNHHRKVNSRWETIWSAIFGELSGTRQVVATDSVLELNLNTEVFHLLIALGI